jgi:hypothetical protein
MPCGCCIAILMTISYIAIIEELLDWLLVIQPRFNMIYAEILG